MSRSLGLPDRSPPQTRGAETQAAIFAAAERIFAESGLAGARTDVIAASAGVNKALLYYYFKSKEQLYAAVLEDQFKEFNRQALAVLTAPGSARAVLLRYVGLHFDFIRERRRCAPLYHQLLTAAGPSTRRLVRKYWIPRVQALGRLLQRGMREKEFRQADIRQTATSIAALIVFYFSASPVLKMLGPADAYSEANLKCRRREVLDFIRYGLFIDPEAPVT
ncbi:MAG: TetR/AcrR family transcriptional regulator [Verrucomicrobiota bacterium]|nr:TetR/AcrR family transcriptional regulator [Verrucomicrobiota bacterium]